MTAVLAAVVGLLVLAGCVRVDGDLTINGASSDAPDTVSGTMLVAISDDWAISQGEDPTNISDAIAEELAANPDGGITGEPYAQDGYTGTMLTFDRVPIERMSPSTDGALSIESEGGGYVVSGDLSVLNPSEEAGSETPPWTAHLALTFPEDVDEHNGTLEGRTVTWDLDASSADPTIYASAGVEPPAWWTRVPVALWILVVLAGVGAVVAWWFGRRQSQREAEGDGGFRARQARARGASTAKLDDMLAEARRQEKRKRD